MKVPVRGGHEEHKEPERHAEPREKRAERAAPTLGDLFIGIAVSGSDGAATAARAAVHEWLVKNGDYDFTRSDGYVTKIRPTDESPGWKADPPLPDYTE